MRAEAQTAVHSLPCLTLQISRDCPLTCVCCARGLALSLSAHSDHGQGGAGQVATRDAGEGGRRRRGGGRRGRRRWRQGRGGRGGGRWREGRGLGGRGRGCTKGNGGAVRPQVLRCSRGGWVVQRWLGGPGMHLPAASLAFSQTTGMHTGLQLFVQHCPRGSLRWKNRQGCHLQWVLTWVEEEATFMRIDTSPSPTTASAGFTHRSLDATSVQQPIVSLPTCTHPPAWCVHGPASCSMHVCSTNAR